MRIQSIILFGMLLAMQPVFSSSYSSTNVSANSKFMGFQYVCKADDDFEIDFDAIDRELELLKLEEKKPQKSWWITKQLKHIGTRIMIRFLLGYIALQEFCTEKWHAMSKRVCALVALGYSFKSTKKFHEPQKF